MKEEAVSSALISMECEMPSVYISHVWLARCMQGCQEGQQGRGHFAPWSQLQKNPQSKWPKKSVKLLKSAENAQTLGNQEDNRPK